MKPAMTLRLSRLGTAVGESATLRQNARVGALRAEGRTIHNFTVGEPDCETPASIRLAAHHAIDHGYTHYTPSAGTMELRAAVARHYAARHGSHWEAQQAIVSAGVKQVLWTALAAVVEPGDEVVLVAPYWVSYAAYIKLLGGTARVIRPSADNDYKACGDDLRAVLGPKTRVVLFNTPVNPTGAVYSAEEQRELLAPLLDHDALLVTDEIYENMIYGVEHVSPIQSMPDLRERTLVTSGASKSYAMTGWRIGYGLGPQPLIQAMTNLQSHMTGNPCSVSQRAALAALSAPRHELSSIGSLFARRREICLEILRRVPEIRFPEPHGAFYFFLDVRPFYGEWRGGRKIENSTALAEHLLESHGLAVVPGIAFDHEGAIRVSYTLPDAELRSGLERLVQVLRERA